MAILDVLHYPDPRLRNRAALVPAVDNRLRQLVDDMFETMYAAPGIGLAAIQVNVPLRVITVDVSAQGNEPVSLINPEILELKGQVQTEEGCLSVPGIYDLVERAEWVRVKALDYRGEPLEMTAEGLLAVCIQHEIDHLDGKLFVDYLSQLKRQRIRKKAHKRVRQSS